MDSATLISICKIRNSETGGGAEEQRKGFALGERVRESKIDLMMVTSNYGHVILHLTFSIHCQAIEYKLVQ